MLTYTVVGYYADNNQPFRLHIITHDARTAEWRGVLQALDLNGWGPDSAHLVKIVAVLAGHADAVMSYGEVANGYEILGLRYLKEELVMC